MKCGVAQMKSKARRFHPSFVADLQNATCYYDDISPEIGNKLRVDLQSKIELITSAPEGFAEIHKNVRALRLKAFPFVVLYRSCNDHVQFVGLVQGSTDRKHWFDTIE